VPDSFWLSDLTSTLVLDSNVSEITLGAVKRQFDFVPFVGSHGGQVKGMGQLGVRTFAIARREYVETSDLNFVNSRRTDLLTWFLKAGWTNIYLYRTNGENTITSRTLIFTDQLGAETGSSLRITNSRQITVTSPWGYFQRTTATTDSEAIPDDAVNEVDIDNDGDIETPVEFTFTPTGDETMFSVIMNDQFGFILTGSFSAGVDVVYNTGTNVVTIDGNIQQTTQYLSQGGVFNLPSGTTTLTVLCSGACTMAWSFYERYI
jgi:hypothetical protein